MTDVTSTQTDVAAKSRKEAGSILFYGVLTVLVFPNGTCQLHLLSAETHAGRCRLPFLPDQG